jgi:hypothetical protein
MEREEFETTLRTLFAEAGRNALRKAMRKQPLQFAEVLGLLPDGARHAPAAAAPLTDEETDLKVIGLLRALGEERLNRLLARARQETSAQ